MQDTDRIIGKLEEFREWSKKRFDHIERQLEDLNRFKWKIAGGAAVLSGLFVALFEALKSLKGG